MEEKETKEELIEQPIEEPTKPEPEQKITYRKNEEETSFLENKTKSKLPIVILSALALILVAGFFALKMFNNPKKVFLTSIADGYKQLNNIIKESGQDKLYKAMKNQTYQIKTDSDIHIELHEDLQTEEIKPIIEELNRITFHSETTMDPKEKRFNLQAKASYDQDDIIHANLYAQNDNIYVQLVNLLDQYIEIPIENYEELFNQQDDELENLNYLIDKIGNSFVNAINEKDFKTSKEKIIVDGKEISTTKISYRIDSKKAYEIMSKMAKDIKDDDKTVSIISEYTKVTKEEIIKNLEEFINAESQIEEESEAIVLSIYEYNNEAVRYELVIDETTNSKIVMTTTEKQTKIELIEENTAFLTITHKKVNENESTTTITMSTIELILNTVSNNNKTVINYELSEIASQVKIHGSISMEQIEVTENKDYKDITKFIISIDMEGMNNVVLLEINSTSTIKIGVTTEEETITNTITVEELTEEQIDSIVTKLFENEAINNFMNAIDAVLYDM